MDIVKTFDEKINPDNISKIKNKELIYAMDLLSGNHDLPKDEFKLKFIISSYYTVSMVKQLKYEYDSEIKLFDVIKKNKIERYTFLKGNFIEKKILKH